MVRSPPLPEKFLDLRHIRSAGDVLYGFVINRHHRGAVKWLSRVIRETNLHRCVLTRLVFRLRRDHVDVEHPLFRRHHNLLQLRIHVAAGHCECLDEEVRYVFPGYLDRDDGRLPVQAQNPGLEIDAVGGANEENDGAARLVGIDHQVHRLPGPVGLFVRNEFQLTEPKFPAVESFAANDEDMPAFDPVALRIRQLIG